MYLAAPPPAFRRGDWPTITEVVDQLRATHKRCFTVLDDVIIAGPPAIQQVIDFTGLEQWNELVAHRDRLQGILRPLIHARGIARPVPVRALGPR